ncbi:MAG: YCF48-related protein, partial [Gammaproteobacteria bacterium]
AAVGVNGTVLATTDGGRSWTAHGASTPAALLGVDFVDAERGWAVGDGGTVLATTDSGRTWTVKGGGTPF